MLSLLINLQDLIYHLTNTASIAGYVILLFFVPQLSILLMVAGDFWLVVVYF